MTGWPFYRISSLASKVGSGSTPKGGKDSYHANGIPLIRSMNVHFNGFRHTGLAFISDRQASELENVQVQAQDVLLNITGASIGRVTIAPSDMEGARVNQHVCIIRPIEILKSSFLAYYLSSAKIQKEIIEEQSGVTRQALTKAKILNFGIPVPPLSVQKRIVDAIDDHFSRLDEAVMLLERVQRNLKRYRASVLKAAVEGRLVPTEAELARAEGRDYEPASVLLERILNERQRRWSNLSRGSYRKPIQPKGNESSALPEGWCWTTIDQLTAGYRNSGYGVLVPGEDVNNGISLIRVGDITEEGIVRTVGLKKISKSIADQFSKTYLTGNEVLITLVGTIGRTAIVPESLAGANVARAVGVIPVSELISSHWVEVWLRSPDVRQEMISMAHEVARKTLNLEDVRSAAVALPPLSEQLRILKKINELESNIQSENFITELNSRRINMLRQSILKHAFEGKLVDQDPSDEPASVLLERIRAERAAAEAVKKPNLAKRKAGRKKVLA